jgi:hypothetical protein
MSLFCFQLIALRNPSVVMAVVAWRLPRKKSIVRTMKSGFFAVSDMNSRGDIFQDWCGNYRFAAFAWADHNYLTFEILEGQPSAGVHVVFFEVEKDRLRKKRLLLRVASAYRMDALTSRHEKGGKVKFNTRTAVEG